MAEFASATLLTALRIALAADGIAVDLPRRTGALIPLALKRQIVTAIARKHGLLPLVRVGRIIPALPPDPAVAALIAARLPAELFQRWNRLERFTHSHHRVAIRDAGPNHVAANHVGPAGAPPTPAEDMLILGVLTALLTAIGAHDLRVAIGQAEPVTIYRSGAWMAPPDRNTQSWQFAWACLHPGQVSPIPQSDRLDSRVERLIGTDLNRRWLLRDVADTLQMSPRSLQRGLHGNGGFGTVLAKTRTSAAADLLMTTDHSLGLIGFACGYADQPHFTREFKRHAAMTPVAYRTAFAARTKAKTT